MAIDYTAQEVGGFDTSYYTQLTIQSDGTTSSTSNFVFEKVSGTSTELVITKGGATPLSTTVGGDGTNASDLMAYEYTLSGNTYLAVFFMKGDALHYAVYNDQLEVVEAEATLTSGYVTLDDIHGIYMHADSGQFIVDASSNGGAGNFLLSWQNLNSPPSFLPDTSGEAFSDQVYSFGVSDVGQDEDGDAITVSGSVASGNAISFTGSFGTQYVIYTGPLLADGATAIVTMDLTLSDGSETTAGSYDITFEGTGSSVVTLDLEQARALMASGFDTLSELGGVISGLTISDTGTSIAGLDAEELAALSAVGVKTFDASDSSILLTLDQAETFEAGGFSFAANDDVALTASAVDLAALLTSDISALAALGVDSVGSADEVITISRSAYNAFTNSGISFTDEDSLVIEQTGTRGKDKLSGTEHADTIIGLGGNDGIQGGAGGDTIRGNEGNDVLNGGDGDDGLFGGVGDDRLSGGAGADSFFFSKWSGHDTIVDFEASGTTHDTVVLSSFRQFDNFADVKSHLRQVGDDVVLKIDAHSEVTFKDVSVRHFTADDFLF